MKKQNAVNKMGFTLLELLIVILIIGLLSAISIPMYKKAVEKSKVSDALSTMQAVSKSEHGWYLVRNNYTKDFANLDIDLYDKDGNKAEDEILQGVNYTYELLDSGILATRTNGEYSIYQDYDTKQIMCTPGTHFICDNLGAFTKEPCEKVGLAWANTNSTCYANEEARCKGLYDDDTWNGDFCGYTNTNGQELNEGMECISTYYGCQRSVINDGGKCEAKIDWYGCRYSTINAGGVCEANNVNGCVYSTINAGGKCIGNAEGGCDGVIVNEGGIFETTANNTCRGAQLNGGTCEGNNASRCRGNTINEGGLCKGTGEEGCYRPTINNGGKCEGYDHVACGYATINEGGVCDGKFARACQGAVINSGGVCMAAQTDLDQQGNGACNGPRINSGGICKGQGKNGCRYAGVYENGECWAEAEGACSSSSFYGTGATSGCCRGQYCPSNAPRCECTNHEKMDSNGNCITA